MDKTDIPDTFNAGATLGPVNPVRSKTLKMSADVQAHRTFNEVNETNMARIWNKHKQSNTPLRRKVFVGLSGGVDSSVSAALLKKAGYDVTGVFIRVWNGEHGTDAEQRAWREFNFSGCTATDDRLDAMRVCAKLGVPFITLDLSKEYKKEVVDYMIREYRAGKTPNPDVMCNRYIKFGGFYEFARRNGADYVATGHYARIAQVESRKSKIRKVKPEQIGSGLYRLDGLYRLLTGLDSEKDQSYFLWTLKQEQLAHTLFPVGGMLKPEVRKLAKKFGLPTADKKDSQGLCFLGKIDVKEFLKQFIKTKKGDVLNDEGEVIGTHDGAMFFTLGERHHFTVRTVKSRTGADLTQTNADKNQKPYYVVAKDVKKNTLTVSHNPKRSVNGELRTTFEIKDVNWINGSPPAEAKILARIRYRQPLQEARFTIYDLRFTIKFKEVQNGGDWGQSVVIYEDDVCLGGGIIC